TVSNTHAAFGHAAGDTKAEGGFVRSLDASGKNQGLACFAFLDGDRSHWTRFGSGAAGFIAAGGEHYE
ncbi:MAG TPA: hypothetical protein VEA77_07275, partial [Hyphomicrobium sp.]|nr:hypothetical protein [Hyphomicrobium sp.]